MAPSDDLRAGAEPGHDDASWDAAAAVADWHQATASLDDIAQVTLPAEWRQVRIRQLQGGDLRFTTRTLGAGADFVGIARCNVGYATSEEWTGDFVGLTVAMDGAGGVRASGQALDDTTIAYGGRQTGQSMYVPAGQGCIGVHVGTADFEAACRLLEVDMPATRDRGLRVEHVPAERLHAFRAFVARLQSLPAGLAFGAARARGESLARQLVRLVVGEGPVRRSSLVAAGRLRAVRRIDEQVLAAPNGQYTLAELCRIACVSPRTLEYAFHSHFDMSPIAYVRALRLQESRRLLRQGRVGVTEAATRCGFTHLGQFSADFRRMFGVLPSRVGGGDPDPRTIAES